jgi:hypothetical protein
MPHNVALPKHKYVWVRDKYIYNTPEGKMVPAVWFGVSSHPGRSLGCHVLLENGASIIDLPLSALSCIESPRHKDLQVSDVVAWDSFGWDMQAFEPEYLAELTAHVLGPDHRHTCPGTFGTPMFALDWVGNGWSDYPEQHKWLWVVACEDGRIMAVPQDRVMFEEASFTDKFGILPDGGIKRQTQIWSAE